MRHISAKRRAKARARAINTVMNTKLNEASEIKDKLYAIAYSVSEKDIQAGLRALKNDRFPSDKSKRVIAHVIDQTGITDHNELIEYMEDMFSGINASVVAGVKSAKAKDQYVQA